MLENEIDYIKKINELSMSETDHVADDQYHSISTSLGDYWFSFRDISNDITYQAQLPCGIHIGAGTASLAMTGTQIKDFSSEGPLASYFIQHPDNIVEVQSTLKKGPANSCGLFIAWNEYESLPDEVVSFLDKITAGTIFNGSSHISALTVEQLCSPIYPNYQGDAAKLIAESRSYKLLASVMAAFSISDNTTSKINYRHRKLALQTKDIISANLMKPMTLQYLAKEIGINVRSLTQLFKYQFGMSINQHIVEQRMMKALTLLETGSSVSETAYKVGYSLPYFSEKFHRRFGFSPSHVSPNIVLLDT